MVKYCSKCGAKLNDDAQFCDACGKPQNEPPKDNKKIIIIGLLVVIIIISIFLIMNIKNSTELSVVSDSSITNNEAFSVKLTSNGKGISNAPIHITFNNNGKVSEFDATTDSNGIAGVNPNLNNGEYEVTCEFKGEGQYSPSSINQHITIEPNYESYSYGHSFEETDTNDDGFVTLNEMNIAHTPKNIRDKMYADSDDDNDGKLNKHEYYKFMYKLNYDRASYGL